MNTCHYSFRKLRPESTNFSLCGHYLFWRNCPDSTNFSLCSHYLFWRFCPGSISFLLCCYAFIGGSDMAASFRDFRAKYYQFCDVLTCWRCSFVYQAGIFFYSDVENQAVWQNWKLVFDSHKKKNVSLRKNQCQAGRPVHCLAWQKLSVAIFSNTVNVINVKLCVIVLLVERCLFIPLSVTLTIF